MNVLSCRCRTSGYAGLWGYHSWNSESWLSGTFLQFSHFTFRDIFPQSFLISPCNTPAAIVNLLKKSGAHRLLTTHTTLKDLVDGVKAELESPGQPTYNVSFEETPSLHELNPLLETETAADPFEPYPSSRLQVLTKLQGTSIRLVALAFRKPFQPWRANLGCLSYVSEYCIPISS